MADPHDFDPGDLEESLAKTPSSDPVLPFPWKELPHEPVGFRGYRARKEKSEWSLTLSRGRVIHLYSLRQAGTDANVLAGSPRSDSGFSERLVKNAIRSIARELECEAGDIAVLPPLLLRSIEKKPPRQPGPAEIGVDYLPPVRTLAVFDSAPVSDPGAHFSTLAVLWFQNSYGLPERGYVTEQLRTLDWDRLAKDGSW